MIGCALSSCGNAPRYIRADGKLSCGVHALGHLAIQLVNVPRLLEVATAVLDELEGSTIMPAELAELRGLIGRAAPG